MTQFSHISQSLTGYVANQIGTPRRPPAVGINSIVTPVKGELKANRTYGLSVSGFIFRGFLNGVKIGYYPTRPPQVQPEWFYKGDGSVIVPPGGNCPGPPAAVKRP
jgi:hypothetical protein